MPPVAMRSRIWYLPKVCTAGFATFLDPPKESAKAALAALAADRVAVKIITGDNELVTQHVCAQLDLRVMGVLTGAEIQKMDDAALSARRLHRGL